MKPATVVFVACAFAAGVGVGMSGTLAKAGNGLSGMMSQEVVTVAGRTARITAQVQLQHDSLQPADFRWNSRADLARQTVCAPKDSVGHVALPAIQHL